MAATITPALTETFARDGVVLVKGLFSTEWIEVLRKGVEANMADAALRCVPGSHLWPRDVWPTRWVAGSDFYPGDHDYMPVPDPEAEGMPIAEWPMQPGDAVAFHFRTLHGARGNTTQNRRRAFSLRLVGDDARHVERAGPTSPPFAGHGMQPGQVLREDWLPVLRDHT